MMGTRTILMAMAMAIMVSLSGVADAKDEPFCTDDDWVICDASWVKALERLSKTATPEAVRDMAHIAMDPVGGMTAAGMARMLSRVLHRGGHSGAAFGLLDDAQRSVFGEDWGETALVRVSIAKQRHALGDPNALRGVVPSRIDWPASVTAFERMNFLQTLAAGIDDIGDRPLAEATFRKAMDEAMRAPPTLPDGAFGDRLESLAGLWITTNRRDFRDLTAKIEADLIPLIESQAAYRRDRGTWPLTVEDFRNGPLTGGPTRQ